MEIAANAKASWWVGRIFTPTPTCSLVKMWRHERIGGYAMQMVGFRVGSWGVFVLLHNA